MKSVTVLVAVLNKTETIENCIESLLKLSYPDYKIMVVDGYSKDGTYEKLKKFENRVILRQFPENLSKTFNWAISQIDTDYMAFTDGDCVVSPDWLDKLMAGFDKEGIVATAGYCGTPLDVSFLQRIIGCELESRFKKFPKYINRAPTMNLAVKTEIAKKVKFDEDQRIGVEFGFGYNLLSFGKIKYIPEAKVYHYHRSSWKEFFKQNRGQARWGLYIISKFGNRATGDHITTKGMIYQIYLFSLLIIVFLLSLINSMLIWLLVVIAFFLFALYYLDFRQYEKELKAVWYKKYPALMWFYLVRNLALVIGLTEGVFIFLKLKTQKNGK